MARASAEVIEPSASQSCSRFLLVDNGKQQDSRAPGVPELSPEFFQSWSRAQLLQYIHLKTGTSKYKRFSRPKLIERLLIIETAQKKPQVSRKPKKDEQPLETVQVPEPPAAPSLSRRTRKGKIPCRLPALEEKSHRQHRPCKNAACRAVLGVKEDFCKRCSCCICKLFDDNKDPSLWIQCRNCSLSSHVECALKSKAAGVVRQENVIQLDGSFSCPGCGYISDLLGYWIKQLNVAKDARRIDAFTSRLSLACQLFHGTLRFKPLHEMVFDAAKELEEEIGPAGLASKSLVRGLVTRLSCGARIQGLIEGAIQKATSWSVEHEKQRLFVIKGGALERVYKTSIEEVTSESVAISWSGADSILGEEVAGHKIWCRAAAAYRFPLEPKCIVFGEVSKAQVTGLYPGVDYVLKIVPFTRSGDEAGFVEVHCSTVRIEQDVEKLLEFHKRLENAEVGPCFRIRDIWNLFPSKEPPVRTPASSETEMLAHCTDHSAGDTGKLSRSRDNSAAEAEKLPRSREILAAETERLSCFKELSACDAETLSLSKDAMVCNTEKLSFSRDVPACETEKLLDISASETQKPVCFREESMKSFQEAWKPQAEEEKCVISESKPSTINSQQQQDCESAGDCPPPDCSTSSSMDGIRSLCCNEEIEMEMEAEDEKNMQIVVHPWMNNQEMIQTSRKRLWSEESSYDDEDPALVSSNQEQACMEKSFEFSVKVVVWLERQGYLEPKFRLKFLTWLGFRASEEEKKVVFVFIRTLLSDPVSLARQLIDSFQEIVSAQRLKCGGGGAGDSQEEEQTAAAATE